MRNTDSYSSWNNLKIETGDCNHQFDLDGKSVDALHCKGIQQTDDKFRLWRQTDLDYSHDLVPTTDKTPRNCSL